MRNLGDLFEDLKVVGRVELLRSRKNEEIVKRFLAYWRDILQQHHFDHDGAECIANIHQQYLSDLLNGRERDWIVSRCADPIQQIYAIPTEREGCRSYTLFTSWLSTGGYSDEEYIALARANNSKGPDRSHEREIKIRELVAHRLSTLKTMPAKFGWTTRRVVKDLFKTVELWQEPYDIIHTEAAYRILLWLLQSPTARKMWNEWQARPKEYYFPWDEPSLTWQEREAAQRQWSREFDKDINRDPAEIEAEIAAFMAIK